MTTTFYDDLAPFYHLLYQDWEASIERQGDALAAVLGEHGVAPGARVLDAACGIGTQTIGLAERGFRVRASDVSPGAAARAREELRRRGLDVEVAVADLRDLAAAHPERFSAVIACDNAVPHLLSDADILRSFRQGYDRLSPGGVLVISVRDYAVMARRNQEVHPYGAHREGGCLYLAVQVWEWEGDEYDLRLYLTKEEPNGTCTTRVLRSRYYAVPIARLMELMREAGFTRVERRDGVFFQPLLVGVRDPSA